MGLKGKPGTCRPSACHQVLLLMVRRQRGFGKQRLPCFLALVVLGAPLFLAASIFPAVSTILWHGGGQGGDSSSATWLRDLGANSVKQIAMAATSLRILRGAAPVDCVQDPSMPHTSPQDFDVSSLLNDAKGGKGSGSAGRAASCSSKLNIVQVQVTSGDPTTLDEAASQTSNPMAITSANALSMIGRTWAESRPECVAINDCNGAIASGAETVVGDFTEGASWMMESAEQQINLQSPTLIATAAEGNQWREFGRLALLGDLMGAAETLSSYVPPDGADDEPAPSTIVMHDARFWFFGAAHDCSTLVTGGCWGRARSYHFEANPTECINGDSSLPSYDTLALVSSKKNLPYYHFFMEVLPRVASILPLLHSHPDIGVALDTKLLFSRSKTAQSMDAASLPGYVVELLHLLGIDSSRLILPKSRHTDGGCAKTLIIPEPVGCIGPSHSQLHILRSYLLRSIVTSQVLFCRTGSTEGPESRLITMIRRSRQHKRHVVNEGEIISALKTMDGTGGGENTVRVVEHDGHQPLLEQLTLFAESDVAIGPHGAALSNVIVMKRGSGVVEFLASGSDMKLLYMAIALKLGLQYRGVVVKGARHTSTFRVDVAESMQAVESILNAMEVLHRRRRRRDIAAD